MANIEIGGRLHSTATGNVVTGANEVLDDTKNKKQSVINAEVDETIGDDNTEGTIKGRIKTAEGKLDTLNGDSSTSGSVAKAVADAKTELIGGATSNGNTLKKVEDRTATLETAVGSNGSVDQRIAAAKSEVIGDAASDYNTLGKLEDKIQAEASARESAVSTEAQARQDAITAETNRATTRENQIYDLVHTPEQHYVTVATYADLANIASPSDDTIYRVSSYNGKTSQVDNTVYSEYGYDGTNFVFLCVKSQIDEVYDISAHHSNNTYVDLAAALDGGNNIPQELRRGGMSVKFVQSSDNKYVQYRLMNNQWSTTESDWQGVDDVPTAGSNNLVKSGGVFEVTDKISEINKIESYSNIQDEYLEIKSNNNEEILKITFTESYGEQGLLFDIRNNNNNSFISAYNRSESTILRIDNKYLITKREFIVDKNGNGTHTSLIRAIIDAEKHMDSVVRVNEGVYNFIDELMDYYGSDYFSAAQINNSTIVEGGKGRGIYLKNRIKLIFSSKSKVIYHYTGDYPLAQTWVSPFNSGEHGFYIENLTLECSNCRYAFHDEMGGSTEPYRNEYVNCRMTFDNGMNPYVARQCIGGGLGENGEIIIRDSYFYSVHPHWASEYFKKVISYHNSSHNNAKSTIVITGCNIASPGGSIVITWYGTSTEKTKALISNNWVGQPVSKEAETQDATIDNIDLYEFNNINRNEVLNN